MHLNNFTKIKKETQLLIILISFSFIIRIPVVVYLGDVTIENEWTSLLHNLINHNVLSLKEFDNFLLPNLLMPPLYAYYLYIFSLINFEYNNFILLVLFSQSVLASVSVCIFFKINKFFFSEKISFYSSLFFSLIPIYLYACSQISSISLTIFFALFFYYYFFKITYDDKKLNIFLFAIIGGLLILLRREFIMIVILSSLFLLLYSKVSLKKFFLIILISIVTISPYLIRNYITFDKIIISSGFGYNLWKANNPNAKIEGSEKIEQPLQDKINNLSKDKYYRINENIVFKDEAIKNIKNDPKKYLILYFKKIASFFFIDLDSSQKNYYNPFHFIPIVLLGATSLIGIFISNKKSHRLNYVILLLFFYLLIFSIFAILPRYKLYILAFQIILSNIFIDYIIKKITNINKKKFI